MKGREVHIHYHRPPHRKDVYVQTLVLDAPEVKVTFQPATPIPSPVEVEGRVVLEPGAPAVWFTFPGLWHDIGRFHDASGRFTGLYANILTPCVLHDRPADPPGTRGEDGHSASGPLVWDTTDLFLDVWAGADGLVRLLDQEDLDAAEAAGIVTPAQARSARAEARRILAGLRDGDWPPPVVEEWTLARVRTVL
ncbi:MAG TPA: DUF402 domain-containing protein [Longimicrobiales bacterium]|nr:DUF402 domain-containing protein [Longimicrobiales bacterium]